MKHRQAGRALRGALTMCAAAAVTCGAQQLPQVPSALPQDEVATLRVTTRTVEVAAVVRNKAGDPQNALTKEDFLLKVDGKEQPIQHFSVAADLPLTLGLLVDVSASQRTFISDEWRASDIFFKSMLTRPQDRAMLVQIDARVLVLMGMTDSTQRLHLALTQLGESASASQATMLNDAVYLIARDKLAKEKGRKAIVLLTDGGDNGSRTRLEQAIEQAQRGNVPVYAIDYSAYTGPGSSFAGMQKVPAAQDDPGEAILHKLALSTGGHVYTVSRTMTLQHIFEQISSDLRTQYEIGYTPPADLRPNSFHKLELQVKDRKLTVQARNGFYVQP